MPSNPSSEIVNFYTGKKILITGANAYLGPALALVLSGVDCRLILHGHSEPKFNFAGSQAKIEVQQGDLSPKSAWANLLHGTDIIFHLAAHEARNFEPEADLTVNAVSVLNLLETCRAKSLQPKIVFVSSANLVGLTERLPVDETFPDRPLTIYAIHKLTAEHYFRYYAQNFGIPSVTLRLSNVYGPSVSQEATARVAFNRMMAGAIKESKLKLFKNRHCVRDYLFINDAIAALLAAGADKKIFDGGYYLIGSEKGYDFQEFARLIANGVKKQFEKIVELESDDTVELLAAEFRNFVADSSRFKKLTGWKARVSLEEGIEKTIEYFFNYSNS